MTPTKPVPTGPMATQPVVTITAITSLASAILATVALVVDLPPDTEKVVLGLITAAWPVITAAWTWHKVYSPATAQKEVNRAALTGTASDVAPPPPKRPALDPNNPGPPETWGERPLRRQG